MSSDDLELPSGTVHLNSRESTFIASVTTFIERATELIQQKGDDNSLLDFNQTLAATYGECMSYLYLTRKYRDQMLAEGFARFPKPQYNSEAQVAMARKHASAAVRLHELMKEIADSIKVRLQVNRQHIDIMRMEK